MASDVLLISPPGHRPDASCPALGTLAPLLEASGIATRTLYASLLMDKLDVGHELTSSLAAHLFAPALYDDVSHEQALDALIEHYLADMNLQGLFVPAGEMSCELVGLDEGELRASFRTALDAADRCVERCVERVLAGGHRVVGFSATFETQVTAALAIARRIRRRAPHLRTALGGAACFATFAAAVVGAFEALDVVCYSEGEAVVVPLMRALLDNTRLDDVAGVVYRADDGAVRVNPPPPLTRDLDALPIPDYRDFVAQLEASPWRDLRPRLLFETSRGCWWGEKQHCTFCGLNAEGMAFRRKSPERAYDEIATLYERHPTARRLECVDNIIDMGYLGTLLPRLADMPRAPERPLRIFYETKSNLRREQLALMAAAGIEVIQPGIESFHDGVLALMRKGATALTQIQLIKWAYELGIALSYNILLRTPGEQASWYREMTALIPRLSHLPPPEAISPLWLERFSPYQTSPERFGISALRPRRYYEALYPADEVDLDAVAYVFDYEHDNLHDPELRRAHLGLVASVHAWQRGWREGLAYYVDEGERVVLHDHRGGESHELALDGLEARLYRELDRARSRRALGKALAPHGVDETLDAWEAMGLIVTHASTDRVVAVYPRHRAPW